MSRRVEPEKLRLAADAVDEADLARSQARTKEEDARNARNEFAAKDARAEEALLDAGVSGGDLVPPNPPTHTSVFKGGWSNGNWGLAAIAAVILLVALLATLFWLATRSPSHDDVSGVRQTANMALTNSIEAKAEAKGATTTANRAAADASSAKADASNALSTALDAKASAGKCGCDKEKKPAPRKQRRAKAPVAFVPPTPAPAMPAGLKPGGCIYESDGTAILKGTTVRQSKGKELDRISDEGLRSSTVPAIKHILSSHPDAFVTNDGHKLMCKAWSHYTAYNIQAPDGLRVNEDTHRTSN